MEKVTRNIDARIVEVMLTGRTLSGEPLFKTIKLEFFENNVSVGFFLVRYYPKYKMINLLDFHIKEKYKYTRDKILLGYGSSVLQNFKQYIKEKGLVCFLIDGIDYKKNPAGLKGWYRRHGWKHVPGSTSNHIYYSGRQTSLAELTNLVLLLHSRYKLGKA